MRFRLTLAAVGALAAAWAAAAPAGAASLNPQHAGLQVALRAQGLYLGPIDAIIGPKTVAAVRAFQRTLVRGKFGWDVAVMQFLLAKHGVRVPVNAYMDTPTVAGLKRYQRAMHLAADGVAGPRTFAALGLQSHVPVRAVTLASYVVKPGDSLTIIARRNHTTLTRLTRLNRINPTKPLLIGTH